MSPRIFLLAALTQILAMAPAHAQTRVASAETIEWVARGCTPDEAFGLRFGEPSPGPRYRSPGGDRPPFPRLTPAFTERSGLLFRVDMVGMFAAGPQSTETDAVAGERLFEAIDARIVQLGAFANRERVVDGHGDIEITYSQPTAHPDSRVVLEMTFMLGGVWVGCVDQGLREQHIREVLE